MDTKRIETLKSQLIALIENYDNRTKKGLENRNAMVAKIKKGEIPTGYRYDFLQTSAYKVVDTLGELAQQFDDEHPDDRCTSVDFIDILSAAIEVIREVSNKIG